MDFYDHNIVSIGHSDLDEDWIIRDTYWNTNEFPRKTRRIDTSKTLDEMVDLKRKDSKIDKKDYYLKSREPFLEETDLHFSFWHVLVFSPLNTLPADTEFHVRKYECMKHAHILEILEEKHYEKLVSECIYYTPSGTGFDELQLVLQFTIPSTVKPCDLPKEHLSAINWLLSIHLREPDSCVPFSGKTGRSHYLSEFIQRCENLVNTESRSLQPSENPHVSSRKKIGSR